MLREFSYNGHIEKAELVKFSQIKCGDIIWASCDTCEDYHRYMPIKFITNSRIIDNIGQKGYADVWETTNIWPHSKNDILAIYNNNINYRVINPIEDLAKEIEKEFLDRKLFV